MWLKKGSKWLLCLDQSLFVFSFQFYFLGEQGQHLPLMWSGSIPAWCFMWLEFVVGSHPCFEGYSPGSPVFLPPQKHSKFQCDQDRRSTRKPAKADVASSLNISNLFLYFITGVKSVLIYEFARHYFSAQRQNVKYHCKLLSPCPYTVTFTFCYTHFDFRIFPSAILHPHFSIHHPPSTFYHPHFSIRHPPSAAIRSTVYRDPEQKINKQAWEIT